MCFAGPVLAIVLSRSLTDAPQRMLIPAVLLGAGTTLSVVGAVRKSLALRPYLRGLALVVGVLGMTAIGGLVLYLAFVAMPEIPRSDAALRATVLGGMRQLLVLLASTAYLTLVLTLLPAPPEELAKSPGPGCASGTAPGDRPTDPAANT